TYFSSNELHLGEISLECSRAGAAAVALWATQRLFPLVRDGEFGRMLDECRAAALQRHKDLSNDDRFVAAFAPELDIVVWIVSAETLSRSSELAQRFFADSARNDRHLALTELPARYFATDAKASDPTASVMCLRSVLMKPQVTN
ncbi:MAG: aspartate aminotransferase family protein, partial [Pseudomonadota bacterium]|nr:aspartate aminotransferase family protein [Pseudomonadota bacterium]